MITARISTSPGKATTDKWRNAARVTTSACVAFLSIMLLASCSPTLTSPEDPRAAPSPDAPAAASTPSPSPADAFAGVDPCALVPQGAGARLGLTDPREKQVGEARVCRFRIDGATLRTSYTVGIELLPAHGLDDIVAARIEQLSDIGRHPAVRFEGAGGGCAIALGVGDRSRADVTAVGGDLKPACDIVARLAAMIEPAVP
jgi:hypothetical protein